MITRKDREEVTTLALLNRADLALREANTIVKAKDLMNMALTAADWLKRKKAGDDIEKINS